MRAAKTKIPKTHTRTRLIHIGQAQGVRIPKKLPGPHAGWDQTFKQALAKNGPPEIDHEWLDAPLLDDSDMPLW